MINPLVVITGASGFVGRALVPILERNGWRVIGAVRDGSAKLPFDTFATGSIEAYEEWPARLQGAEAVIHLAGLAHDLNGRYSASDYDRVNNIGTSTLAESCVKAGVPKLVFVSTIKVFGEPPFDHALRSDDPVNPESPYAHSKAAAEKALLKIGAAKNLHVSIVRPPLVYGPGVKGNFLRLMELVARGTPLPFGMVTNRRSMVSTWNLCDLIQILVSSVSPPGRIWMVSDSEDLSTPELILHVGRGMDREARLYPVPMPLLRAGAYLLGKRSEFERLCMSLQVDATETTRALQWQPKLSVAEGLNRTTAWYRALKGL